MPMRNQENLLWYKDAIIYEVHIRSFCDSNGDGIGDFRGLLSKLPYLRDLGITAIWVLPFYPSPLKDDGYDIADYMNIHPDYGTLRDFQDFLRGAHRLGMRVITELVLNHTSDQHPWFQRARRAPPGSAWRKFYVWSDTQERYADARIIFKDFETSNWSRDPIAKSYYWHRFYAHQPDLNYDNPKVHQAMFKVIDFWLGMGVDGLRLDAVPYLYEREGTNCENLPETYAFLKKLRAYVEERYPGRMLLAEANQWPEDAASYFGAGDACQMAFHFPLMPRMFMAVQMEDSFPIVNIMQQTPAIPQPCQWALFLRNHDELTLEMVTDEERDYMYGIYAKDPRARINLGIRRRLAPLMGNDRRKIELMNVLLFCMPGTPIIYYGDEIGMGDNYYLGDRNGVRTPMQWSPDRNAGFSATNPQRLYLPVIIDPEYHYEALNVENQAKNPSSLLWWMKRMIDLRKRYKAFGWGTLEMVPLENPKILALARRFEDQLILVVINLSRFPQFVEINNPRLTGYVPEEMLGHTRFPAIKESPYVIIFGPYDYYLLLMRPAEDLTAHTTELSAAEFSVAGSWEAVLKGKALAQLEQAILPAYLRKVRWFQGKGRIIGRTAIRETIPLPIDGGTVFILFIEVVYSQGVTETYLLPLHHLPESEAEALIKDAPGAVLAHLKVDDRPGILYDGLYHADFREALFDMVTRRKGRSRGRLVGVPAQALPRLLAQARAPLPSQVVKAEQSNNAVLYDKSFFLKLYRRLEEGVHPETEIGRFLTDRCNFDHVAPLAGTLEYQRPGAEPMSIALLQGFVPNQGDAWTFTLSEIAQFLDRVLAHRAESRMTIPPVPVAASPAFNDLIGGVYPEMVALLGRRTAEFHLALASRGDDPAFAPEAFSLLYQRSVFQSLRSRAKRVLDLARKNLLSVSEEVRPDLEHLLELEPQILAALQRFTDHKFSAWKTRTHGDFHLGQVLFTGNDFFLIDFEGEPSKTLSGRRIKLSPLRDVAGMIRSFHYASVAVIIQNSHLREEDRPFLEPWAEAWSRHHAALFVEAYLKHLGDSPLIPKAPEDLDTMLDTFLLEKALYELGYELNNRPDWVEIPLHGIFELVAKASPKGPPGEKGEKP
ncbi:maltose alpha-D-glucosyltransferase [Geomesophilobacter sediminis]|uniref:Maltokinase n=1 Tax=Geomesophilobacter sediminis TaxID=2798584 RepID=A0A8J7SBH8_9BACT|nr:maltose alpha-D-glucosyltransferase [Geomesophilobacter sediminis]MBJ6727806.1 maltose alpha-D-glucosyltransferase [Geomesophilobacter sediminis]